MLERLVRIAGEHALVEVLGRAQRRPVAEQHVEELEALDMAAEHDEADRQRRRDQSPIGPRSQVQKIAETTTANGDRPVLLP